MDCELPEPDDGYDDTDERAEQYEADKDRRRRAQPKREATFVHMRECVQHGQGCICQPLQRYGRRRQIKAQMLARDYLTKAVEKAYRDGYNAHARSQAIAREMYHGDAHVQHGHGENP